MALFLRETYVPNLLTITIISRFFIYKLVTYHWKGLKESYNFVIESISIEIHMQKLWSHNIFLPMEV